MNKTIPPSMPPDPDWRDLILERDDAGYAVSERPAGRCCVQRRLSVRRTGLALVAASGLSWLVAPVMSAGGIAAHGVLAAVLCAMGLLCLAASWTCVVRTMRLDLRLMHLRISTRDAGGRERLQHLVPLDAIATLYLRRPDHGTQAALVLRTVVESGEIAVIGGPAAELEALHRKLSRDISDALAAGQDAVVTMPKPAIRPRRVTPAPAARESAPRQAVCIGG